MWRTLGIVMALAAAGCASATKTRATSAADKAKLEADATSWFGFLDKGDTDAMANLYAEDALLMAPGAPAISGRANKRTILRERRRSHEKRGTVDQERHDHRPRRVGRHGVISGNYTVVDRRRAVVDSRQLHVGPQAHQRPVALHPRYVELGSPAGAGYVFFRASKIACTSDSGTSSATAFVGALLREEHRLLVRLQIVHARRAAGHVPVEHPPAAPPAARHPGSS
jgi:hypothetical protein